MNLTNFTNAELDEVLNGDESQVALSTPLSSTVHMGWNTTAHVQQDMPLYAYANTEATSLQNPCSFWFLGREH